jgi:hypothetical protein
MQLKSIMNRRVCATPAETKVGSGIPGMSNSSQENVLRDASRMRSFLKTLLVFATE